MAEPFLGEIRLMSFNFQPKGWAFCNGQLLPINQNQALFSLLGTTYGGNGVTTFALPNLQVRMPIGFSSTHPQGEAGGETAHTLTAAEMPAHTHPVNATNLPGRTGTPAGNFFAAHRGGYAEAGSAALSPSTIGSVGGSQPHENRPPFLALNFCIALQGIFPSRN